MYAFELDRLEPEDGQLVLTGHWSGVRGLRFMRPTLIVEGREVLATLEHKPWAPLDDRPWIAAFPWSGGPVDAASAMLAVAPSITVPLSGGAVPPPVEVQERKRVREQLEGERVRTRRLETEVGYLRDRLTAVTADAGPDDAAQREVAALRGRLDDSERVVEALRARISDAERARDAARRERDTAIEQRDEVLRDRDAAIRTRERAVAERDEAVRERDAAVARRDEALRHREDALVASRTLERQLRTTLADADRDERFEPDRGTTGSPQREIGLNTHPRETEGTVPPVAPQPEDEREIGLNTRPSETEGTVPPGSREEPIGMRQVPATRAEPLLGAEGTARWRPTTVDLWVARALGGAAALSFLLLLVTLLLTLT